MTLKTSIVIPNWNGVKKLQKNLPEILKIAHSNKIEEIIIADDASTDNSLDLLKSDFPEIIVIKSPYQKNSGFSSNVNRGVKMVSGDLIALFNTDAVPEKNFLKAILSHFNNKQVFSVGLNVGLNNGGSWTTAKFDQGFFWHGQGQPVTPLKSHQTLWVSGGSGVFRKDIWDSLGGLEELYDPFYEEDVDLGYRATKRDYINIWEPASQVRHAQDAGVISENFSKRRVSEVAQRNQLIFIWKNITSKRLTAQHQKALLKMLGKHPKYWQIFLSALVKLPQILKKREVEKKEAKLTDEEVFSILANFSV